MTEWKKVKIEDIGDLSNGINFNKSAYTKGVKLIGVADFKDRLFPDYDSLQEVNKDVVRNTDYLHAGDIVFVRSNGNKELVGRCMLIEKDLPVTYSGFCIRLRIRDIFKFNPLFFAYLFKSNTFRKAMSGTAVGANIQNLNQKRLGNYAPLVPDVNTQKKISNILSKYDSLIENYQQQIKLLEEAAQRLYKEWFVDLHFPGYENTKIVDGMPERWEKRKANDYFPITIGRTPPRKESEWFTKGNGVPWVSISDMKSASFIGETSESLTEEAVNRFNIVVVPKGTVLLSFKLTVGRTCITQVPVCTNEAIAHFVTDNTGLRYYTLLYLRYFNFDSLGNTSGISKAINSTIVKNMPFIMPPKNILDSFRRLVAPIFTKVDNLTSQIRFLTEARDRLLPKLMSGEVGIGQ